MSKSNAGWLCTQSTFSLKPSQHSVHHPRYRNQGFRPPMTGRVFRLLGRPSTDYGWFSAHGDRGTAAERDALSLSNRPLFWIWINLNVTCAEGICEICFCNNCDQYSCDACVSRCVSRALRRLPCASLQCWSILSQSLTGELEPTFIFKLCWVPLRKVLSLGPFVTNTFIRRCYTGREL